MQEILTYPFKHRVGQFLSLCKRRNIIRLGSRAFYPGVCVCWQTKERIQIIKPFIGRHIPPRTLHINTNIPTIQTVAVTPVSVVQDLVQSLFKGLQFESLFRNGSQSLQNQPLYTTGSVKSLRFKVGKNYLKVENKYSLKCAIIQMCYMKWYNTKHGITWVTMSFMSASLISEYGQAA